MYTQCCGIQVSDLDTRRGHQCIPSVMTYRYIIYFTLSELTLHDHLRYLADTILHVYGFYLFFKKIVTLRDLTLNLSLSII